DDAIRIDPRQGWAYYCRATLESRAGDLDKASRDIAMAIDLEASHAEFYSLRGLIFSGKDDLNAAMADYDKASQLNSNGALNYARRGLLNEKKGNAELARADFKRALDAAGIDARDRKEAQDIANEHLRQLDSSVTAKSDVKPDVGKEA